MDTKQYLRNKNNLFINKKGNTMQKLFISLLLILTLFIYFGCQEVTPTDPTTGTLNKGKSTKVDLVPYTGINTDAWGFVHYDVNDGTIDYVVNLKGLEPGDEYSLYSKGVLLELGTANGGGNITFNGSWIPTGNEGRFNIWTGDHNVRTLWTGPDLLWFGD